MHPDLLRSGPSATDDVGNSIMTSGMPNDLAIAGAGALGGTASRADSKNRVHQVPPGVYKEFSHGVVLGHALGTSDAPTRVLTNCVNSSATLNGAAPTNPQAATINHAPAL